MLRAPRRLPAFTFLVNDMPTGRANLAAHLGISMRSLQRYEADNQAPRAVMLAMFWESRWGASQADADLHNTAQVLCHQVAGLTRENAALRRRLLVLESELQQVPRRAANLPFFSSCGL